MSAARLLLVAIALLVVLVLLSLEWLRAPSTSSFLNSMGGVVLGLLFGVAMGYQLRFWIIYKPRDKRAAKRFNESVKLAATSLNAMALAVIGAAVIIPLIRPDDTTLAPDYSRVLWIVGALVAHVISHAILGLLKPEE